MASERAWRRRTWEMLVARHLHLEGHSLIPTNGGPDIKFEFDGNTVWVEAVAPEPKGLPAEWLDPSFSGGGSFPHEAIFLGWTTRLMRNGRNTGNTSKGNGRCFGRICDCDHGCQLGIPRNAGHFTIAVWGGSGFSGWPHGHRVNRDTGKIGQGFVSERFHVINANNATVATTPFLDPRYAGVSALVGCAAERTYGKPLDIHVVHNPGPMCRCAWLARRERRRVVRRASGRQDRRV